MGLGIAKIDEETIPKELGNMSLIALDDFRTCRLIGTNDFPVLFGVELGGESGRIDQITEHHGELAAFGFWCPRGHDRRCWFDRWCGLGRSRWDRLGRRS